MSRKVAATRAASESPRARILVLATVAAILVAAWSARAFARAPLDGRTIAAESASDYRLRLVELTLAAAHAPRIDRFVAPPAGTPVPWPPFFHAALAVVARARRSRTAIGTPVGSRPASVFEAPSRSRSTSTSDGRAPQRAATASTISGGFSGNTPR